MDRDPPLRRPDRRATLPSLIVDGSDRVPDDETPGWKLLTEAVRLWLPIIVSLCAIGLTVFQATTFRRHARLSVQPRLEWRVIENTRTGIFEINLVNVGLGPAILKSVAVSIDGTAKPLSGLDVCAEISTSLARPDAVFDSLCFVQATERIVPAGEELSLYRSEPAPGEAVDPSAPPPDYRRFGVTGSYCSFYEECWRIELP